MPVGAPADPGQKAAEAALDRLIRTQTESGAWEGEVVWCPMITAQVVILRAVIGTGFECEWRTGVRRYFAATQRPEGGWGLHPESAPYLYVTTLVYIALRLLGEHADGPLTAPALAWIRKQPGGACAIPTWGKFWLSLIGLYDYSGLNACPPELFMLPDWMFVQADHLYCHTRYIYLGIAYLYGRRFVGALGTIRDALCRELYDMDYEAVPFARYRHSIAQSDLLVRPCWQLRRLFDLMRLMSRPWRFVPGTGKLRRKSLARCLERIRFEQRASRYQGLSPVSGILNTLALWTNDSADPDVAASLAGIESWRWQDEVTGIRYAGARSQTWDTSFVLQALAEAAPGGGMPMDERARAAMRAGYRFLNGAQAVEELPRAKTEHRDPIRGGWCFSDGVHRWPVCDCTAEAVSAVLDCHAIPGLIPPKQRIDDGRLSEAIRFILSRQNADGGFATYERRRGRAFLQGLNPSEMFGSCMTERSYIECTASAVKALRHFRAAHPGALQHEIDAAVALGVAFLRAQQCPDGSYPGFWGINFVYATGFVIGALKAAGSGESGGTLECAVEWIEAHQREDGGWGEDFSSCVHDRYIENNRSLVIMTAWAVLALLEAGPPARPAIRRGVAWLERQQENNGDWPRDSVNGVFFGAAMLDYRLYNTYFPAWALIRYRSRSNHG
jgi:squalene/oxidosqualene cyclase-like protein